MKILNDKDYLSLKEKSDNFDAIVNAIVANGENVKVEDVTVETIIEVMQRDPEKDESELQEALDTANNRVTELESELETANGRVTELETELETANARINELDNTPAEPSAAVASKGENGGKDKDIAQFATENKGDTAAILAQAQKEGLI